jgi:hypothetical protein
MQDSDASLNDLHETKPTTFSVVSLMRTYDEVDVWVPVADLWYDKRQDVNALAVHQPAQSHNSDGVAWSVGQLVGVRLKLAGIHSCKAGTEQCFSINGSSVYMCIR